jgi:hypothetical protein
LFDEIKAHRLKVPCPTANNYGKGDIAIEINLADYHLGKVGFNTNDGTYTWSIEEAERTFFQAIKYFISQVDQSNLSKIIFPVGNDFFNINSPANSTVKGTPQASGIFFEDIFRAGRRMVTDAIVYFSQFAPVEVIMVRVNHDGDAIFSLGEVLDAQFSDHQQICIRNEKILRKYTTFGQCLIGFSHGDKIKAADIYNTMSVDQPGLFGSHKYRYFHTGHLHKNKKVSQSLIKPTLLKDEFHGVEVELCPSLSPTDLWHYDHLYTGNIRRSKAFVYHQKNGLIADYYYVM